MKTTITVRLTNVGFGSGAVPPNAPTAWKVLSHFDSRATNLRAIADLRI